MKNLFFLGLASIAALVLGFFALCPYSCVTAVQYGCYWFLLFTTTLFAYHLFLLSKKYFKKKNLFNRRAILPSLLILSITCLISIHEKTEYKILMDEPVLVGTSMSMHLNREALTPTRAHNINGVFAILGGYVDKRPPLFPFLLSILHDLSGYRVENAFALNFLLTLLLLWLTYIIGKHIGGRSAGYSSILLMSSIPLLIRTANGAGFELLNMAIILACIYLSLLYLKEPSDLTLTTLVFAAILMAYVRYETIIFILPVALIILYSWIKQERLRIPPLLITTPFFLIPYAWQHQTFKINQDLWQLWSKPQALDPFSFKYFFNNLGHAVHYFFDFSHAQPNNIILTLLGLLSCIFFFVKFIKSLSSLKDWHPAQVVLTAFSFGFLTLFMLYMTYYWGQFDDPVVRRLSLPLYIPLVFIPVFIAFKILKTRIATNTLLTLSILTWPLVTLPTIAAKTYSQEYLPATESTFAKKFIDDHRHDSRYLMISDSPMFWLPYWVESISINRANLRKEQIHFYMNQPNAPDIYVFQRFKYNPTTQQHEVRGPVDIDQDFNLQTLIEYKFTQLHTFKISRLLSIKNQAPFSPKNYNSLDEYLIEVARNLP